MVVERLAELLHLRVVEHADREQDSPARGRSRSRRGQRICADVAHCAPPPSREAGRSPPVRCSAAPPKAHRITRSSSSDVPVIRCGVLRGMKQMSPGPRSRLAVADDLRAAALDDHHDLVCVRVVVVLVRRPVRVGRLAERDQRGARVRADHPADVEVAERAPPASSARRRVGAEHLRAAVRAGLDLREERLDRRCRRLRRLQRDRVPGVAARRAARRRSRRASSRPCSGSVRSSWQPTTTSVGGTTSSMRGERLSAEAIARHWRT